MRIVLLGAPGSGKGTQATLIMKKLCVPHISTGELLRKAVEAGTSFGKTAQKVMDRGELVPDDVMLGLIEERLGKDDVKNGFILDGYPRNMTQAKALDRLLNRLGQPVEEALHIDVDEDQVIARIAERATREGRTDDTEDVVRHRMQVYEAQTAPVVNYYAKKGILTRVLGKGSIEEVFQRILGALQARAR